MIDYRSEISGTEAMLVAIGRMSDEVRKETVPTMELFAKSVAQTAARSVSKHPSGLFKKARSAPRYDFKQAGRYLFTVKTPGTNVGKALAISEFASKAVTSRGASMIAALNSNYGRPGGSGGGRILWKAHDDLDSSFVTAFEAAVSRAERKIERQLNG